MPRESLSFHLRSRIKPVTFSKAELYSSAFSDWSNGGYKIRVKLVSEFNEIKYTVFTQDKRTSGNF